MKTRHTEKHSWSIVRSKTTELRLNMSTPKALQTIMNGNTDTKLLEAKQKYIGIMAKLPNPVHLSIDNIVMDLVNIQCGFKLHSNTAGEDEVAAHLFDAHNITLERSAQAAPEVQTAKLTNLSTK